MLFYVSIVIIFLQGLTNFMLIIGVIITFFGPFIKKEIYYSFFVNTVNLLQQQLLFYFDQLNNLYKFQLLELVFFLGFQTKYN